jgi:excisionase family DNA binding protein
MEAYFLSSQVARELDISAQHVRSLERQGKLPAVRTAGGVRLFKPVDVQRLKAKRNEHRSAQR